MKSWTVAEIEAALEVRRVRCKRARARNDRQSALLELVYIDTLLEMHTEAIVRGGRSRS